MNAIQLGEAIQQRREALHISQKRLCKGICTQSTLCKVERGLLSLSTERLDALLQRLDMPSKQYYVLLSKQDYDIQDLKRKVAICNAKGAFSEALKLLNQIEKLVDSKETLIHQFILRSKAIAGKQTEAGVVVAYSPQDRMELLEEAIRVTIPDFQIETIGSELLCFEEVKTIMNLANTYAAMHDQERALAIYEKLYLYVRDHYKKIEEAATVIPMIAYNYSKLLSNLERYQESVAISKEGYEYCIKYGDISLLGALLVNIATCRSKYDNVFSERNALIQAYYILKSMEQSEYVNLLRTYAKQEIDLYLK